MVELSRVHLLFHLVPVALMISPVKLRLACRERRELSLGTKAGILRIDLATATAALVDALVFLADHLGGAARAADGGSIAKVGVDADQIRSHTAGTDSLNDNLARGLALVVGAVTAGAVELAGVDDGVVADLLSGQYSCGYLKCIIGNYEP